MYRWSRVGARCGVIRGCPSTAHPRLTPRQPHHPTPPTTTTTMSGAHTSAAVASATTEIALLFCGQGAQTVGMTQGEVNIPEVSRMYDVAKEVLGYDLKQIVLQGPADTLDDTVHAQPALLLAGLAAAEKLSFHDPTARSRVAVVAGLSLGEYTALVYAGAISFDDALRVVAVRARAMQSAGKASPGKMATVINLDDTQLNEIIAAAARKTAEPVSISNLLFPKGRVVGGSPAAVDAVVAAVKALPGRVIVKELKVSGAFHTSLMASAQQPLAKALAEITIKMPSISVIANTTGLPYTSVDEIRAELVKQIVEPVQWERSIEGVIHCYAQTLYDMGPRQTIKPMIRKINSAVSKNTISIDV